MASADTKFFDLIIKALESISIAEGAITMGQPPVTNPGVAAQKIRLDIIITQLKLYRNNYKINFENLQNNLDIILKKME